MELLQYWKIIRKRLLLILLLVLLGAGGAAVYIRQQVPVYRTTTTLFVSPSTLGSVLSQQLSYSIGALASTYTHYMRTTTFAQLVVDNMPVAVTTDDVLKALSAGFERDTQIFRISATHTNPEVAQMLANTTAQMLISANAERQRSEQEARASAQLSPQTELRRQQMEDLVDVLQEELQYYEDQIRLLESELTVVQGGPSSAENEAHVLQLRSQLLSYRNDRVTVLRSLADSQAALTNMVQEAPADVDTIVVIDEAPLPRTPISDNLLQPLVAAIMGALALGVGLAWFLEYLDYTVKSPEELDELYQLPSQGAIGRAAGSADNRAHALVTVNEPRSPLAEAFRALRTSIRMAGLDEPVRRLLITSAGPGEGKTFVSSNLAVAFAQEGRNVILVDADLRRPRIDRVFGVRREPGFTNLVFDAGIRPAQCLQPTAVPNLRVLACGMIPPQPSELLGSARAAEVMDQLAAEADIIIYDSPPAATVTDAVLIAQQVDAVMQVVGAGVTRKDLILRCRQLLQQAGARILGPVLNRVEAGDLGYYANYYYYGGYYQNEEQPAGAYHAAHYQYPASQNREHHAGSETGAGAFGGLFGGRKPLSAGDPPPEPDTNPAAAPATVPVAPPPTDPQYNQVQHNPAHDNPAPATPPTAGSTARETTPETAPENRPEDAAEDAARQHTQSAAGHAHAHNAEHSPEHNPDHSPEHSPHQGNGYANGGRPATAANPPTDPPPDNPSLGGLFGGRKLT